MTTTIAPSLCAPIGHCSLMSDKQRCCHQNGLLNTGFQGTGMVQSRGICPPDEMYRQSLELNHRAHCLLTNTDIAIGKCAVDRFLELILITGIWYVYKE